MESIWRKTINISEYPHLPGDAQTDAVVIGGGMTGILTACLLQTKGVKTIVLEADRIGSGQTERTTAKITASHNLIYYKLIKQLGEAMAQQYALANQQAIADYARMIAEMDIDCGFQRCPSYLYSEIDEKIINEEVWAAEKIGQKVEFTDQTELPFAVRGAIKFEDQAKFHPLAFLKAAAKDLTIYEQTCAKKVEDKVVYTNRGNIQAKHIIFACHYPFINIPGYYFLRMHQERSYVIALENLETIEGIYLGVDENALSFRSAGDQMLFGGGGHRTGENKRGDKYQNLRRSAKAFWPKSKEIACWSAQDCMTMDDIPYIGRYSSTAPDWYVATGFGKWGMSSAMVSAKLLSEMIIGEDTSWGTVFSPQRFELSASAKNLIEDGGKTIKGFSKRLFAFPKTAAEELPIGHGGIVECDGEKAGVYKDAEGICHIVSVQCPHLGCQLEWNPDELSWDCPCHGSRFDYNGRRLDGPAQEGLQHE